MVSGVVSDWGNRWLLMAASTLWLTIQIWSVNHCAVLWIYLCRFFSRLHFTNTACSTKHTCKFLCSCFLHCRACRNKKGGKPWEALLRSWLSLDLPTEALTWTPERFSHMALWYFSLHNEVYQTIISLLPYSSHKELKPELFHVSTVFKGWTQTS